MEKRNQANFCIHCRALPISLAYSEKHEYMEIVETLRDFGTHGTLMLYRCSQCKTYWLHQDGHNQDSLGFTIWQHSLANYLFGVPQQ